MYDDILLFIKIVNFGGFTQASRQTNIPQPTISRRIKHLEQLLELTLIKRDSRNLELTTHGKNLYAKFKEHEQQNLQLIDELYQTDKQLHGTLNIAVPQGFAGYAIDPYIGSFTRMHPKLKLNLHYVYRDINMIKENFDFAIIGYRPQQNTQKIRLLYRSKQIICCSPSYIKKYGLLQNIEEHGHHQVIGQIDVTGAKPLMVKIYHEAGNSAIHIKAETKIRINSMMHLIPLLKSNEFIAGVSEELVTNELQTGNLIRILPDYHAGYIELYLMSNIDATDSRAIVFQQFLNECLLKVKEINNRKNSQITLE